MQLPLLRLRVAVIFIFLTTVNSVAQTFTSSYLPIVILDTYGQTIQDDPRITIHMGIIDNGPGNINYVTDPFTDYDGEVTIEIRGSTSQQYPKKSYAFTPVDPTGASINFPVLNMPPENDFILYAPYSDKTLMRNTLTYYLATRMGHYASRTRFVEIVRNGYYRGVYELQEKIKRDANRVDVATLTVADTTGDQLTGGYIIKIDKTTGNGTQLWYSTYDNDVFFQYHDPEDTDLLPVQKNYIQNYVNQFETALQSTWFADPDSGFRKFADENSFIDFFILQEIGHTVDGYRSSCFMHKDKDSSGGKLTMGPMWDFNLSYGNADYCDAYDTTGWQYQFNSVCSGYSPHVPFWWNKMLQDTTYKNNLRCRWNQMRQTFLHTDSLHSWIDSVAFLLDDAQQRNFNFWPILGVYVNWNYYVGQTYQEEIDYLKMWMAARLKWLDNHIPGNCIPAGEEENIQAVDNGITIYPNPFAVSTTIQLRNNISIKNGILITYDITGRELNRISFKGNKLILNRNNLAAGSYLLKIESEEIKQVLRVVVQ